MPNVEERKMRALESIASSMKSMSTSIDRLRDTMIELNKVVKDFKESDIRITVDADQLDLPLESEELPLRWGHETVGTVKVTRDDKGVLVVTNLEMDERLPEALKENVQHFSLPKEEG